jgi:FtsH-binding integral membrane protein
VKRVHADNKLLLCAANLFFNRPTREAPLDAYSASYLNSTFRYLGGGIALTAVAAVGLHRSGISRRVMMASPWLVLGVGLVASIGGMIGAQALPPGSPGKYACWVLFNVAQAAVLSPMLFLNPAVLARAGVYTAGIVGSLCYVGATAKERQFLWMGGPLLAGVVVVALSGLAPMVLPATAFRALAVTEALSLYGGLGVFGAFVLYDMSKILEHARLAQMGAIPADPLRESIGLYLDAINIFTRLVAILSNGQRRK